MPRWAWGLLAALAAYQAAMYGWVMRIVLNNSVVLKPWLLSQPGYRLYDNVIDIRLPGSVWLQLALYPLLPDPILRARLSMIVLTCLSTGIIFWLARRWWGWPAALVGAAFYALWGPVIMDHLMYFDVLLGFLALLAVAAWPRTGAPWWRPVLAGVLVGLALLVKQHALAVVAVFVIWRTAGGALWRDWRGALADIGRFVPAAALPLVLVLAILGLQGRLPDALFWVWRHAWGQYLPNQARSVTQARELLLMAGWLAHVPLFAFHALPQREGWRREGILLLGLLPALCAPAFPRYGRFHLSGAMPVVALLGAGAAHYALRSMRSGSAWERRLLRLYSAGVACLLLVALALPGYYRVRLGPRIGEYEALVPLGAWVAEETGAAPGTRVWLLPEYDPTNNFYAITGYLPPTLWVQSAKMSQVPGLNERMIAALEADSPRYAVLFHRWRSRNPEVLLIYLEEKYTPIAEADLPHDIGRVTLYERG